MAAWLVGSHSSPRGNAQVCLSIHCLRLHQTHATSRPVQWSKSSVLFTTHESEPFILGRHFPSSRQFVLPPFHYSLPSYEPATVLALSPADDWLFAYFPGKGNDGVGCAWHKEAQLDRWTLNECWTYPIGGGVITAAWTQSTREVRPFF